MDHQVRNLRNQSSSTSRKRRKISNRINNNNNSNNNNNNNNNSNNNQPIEIVSSDEEPEIIDLDNENEDDIEILNINTRNPTPLANDNNSSLSSQDVQITGQREVPSPSPIPQLHTPNGVINFIDSIQRDIQQGMDPTAIETVLRNPTMSNNHQMHDGVPGIPIPERNLRSSTRQNQSQSQLQRYQQHQRHQQRHLEEQQQRAHAQHQRMLQLRQQQIRQQQVRQRQQQNQQRRNNHPLQDPHTHQNNPRFPVVNFFPNFPGANRFLVIRGNLFGNEHNSDYYDYTEDEENGEVASSILQRIEEDNNRLLDARINRERNYNKKQLHDKVKSANKIDSNHTSNIKPNENENEQSNLVCELCNVVLGQGAPTDFKGDSKYNLNFEKYSQQYKCQAPWFCTNPFTEVDYELSKRIFVAKCGHLFCGRCVKNIGNRQKKTKSTPQGFTIHNPSIFAPSKCITKNCNKKFTAKSFTEVYF
ncbi:unnamed protein product [Candida verbasci]|uniref:RING-type domain-containing protein n=1 Tax=Candida verbasci TaxID=1227364 RepID=A0A9W4X8M7_9ASCO|nr:unnamed protein product [Candida verbasci]